MIFKVGIMGAAGRMGAELTALLGPGFQSPRALLELSDVVVSANCPLVAIEGVNTRTWETPASEAVHVWIDFSRPEGTMRLLENLDTPVVIGTTGFNDDELRRIRDYAHRQPVVMASNTSPGMGLLRKMIAAVPDSASQNFAAVMTEEHHRHKKDAPSGTAKTLLAVLAERGFTNVPVNVVRAGAILGVHEIKFISDEEEIVLTHRVSHRSVFAKGALLAAAFVVGREPGLYSMDDVLEEKTDERNSIS